MGDRVLRHTAEPLSVGVFTKTPGDITDLFNITDLSVSELFLSLNHNLESFACDVTLSSGVSGVLLLCRDLSEDNGLFLVLVLTLKVDSLPLGTGLSLTSDDPRAIG
jgi:hypothetical protein